MIVVVLVAICASAQAEKSSDEQPLAIYEPNRVTYTKDSDDRDWFMDFQLSVHYRIPGLFKIRNSWPDRWYLWDSAHFAFTTRLAQYIGTRDSSPVIGKRFNPKLFFRFGLTDRWQADLAYAHESNGQSIHELPQLQAARERADRIGDGRHSTFDLISRGWDYFELRLSYYDSTAIGDLAVYATGQAYLEHGLLQEDAEDSYVWERKRDLDEREEGHGLSVLLRLEPPTEFWAFPRKWALRYETGIAEPFVRNSLRGELRFEWFHLPVLFWGSTGFDNDLAQFNKRVESFGVGLEFKALLKANGRRD